MGDSRTHQGWSSHVSGGRWWGKGKDGPRRSLAGLNLIPFRATIPAGEESRPSGRFNGGRCSASSTSAAECGRESKMPNENTLTYGRLHAKLRELGFKDQAVELDGKRGRVFEHPKIAATMIVLPERAPDDPVEPFYLRSILATLRSRGLLPETNPLLT